MNNTNNVAPTRFKDMEFRDMEIIKGIKWAETMYETLDAGLKKSFLNWVVVVLTLSQNEVDVKEWKKTFIDQFEERCCEMVADMQELHEQVINNIEKYLKKTQVLCKDLQMEMPVVGHKKLGLYQEQLLLKKRIIELEKIVDARQAELNELHQKQLKLCTSLGREPMFFNANSLPSSTELADIQAYIEKLEQETFDREEKFYSVKEKIIEIVTELEYIPSTKFESDVIGQNESKFVITDNNMRALDKFYYNIQKELEDVKEEIGTLRNKIEQLWVLLDLEFIEREDFRKKYTGNSKKTLEALRTELQRCVQLKKANIKVFIDKLRQELSEVWSQCHCSESVKNDFRFLNSDCYTEDLLELHEVQLEKWRSYFEENRETLSLLDKHKSLWDRMIELENAANGPDRYNNRGGKLLREEKERNLLAKQIPKIEEILMEQAERYEARYGSPFLNYGETILDYINNLYANRENAKQIRLSARKAQKEATPMSTTKCTTALFACTSNMVSKRQLDTPLTDVKKIRLTPRKVFAEPRQKLKLPAGKTTNHNISRAKRLSQERKKRIDKIRRVSKKLDYKKNDTYIEFKNDLTPRFDLRSTLNLVDEEPSTSAAHPLPGPSAIRVPSTTRNITKTPTKIQHKSPKSSTKSPNFNSKLTAAKSQTKLIF
ncbi:unnamed protein product [Psylliodes chrysocephalus]|uniref:Protein regulator of cytokinesis 1 n=1 Tax=Psylliodes chrysocephalus TaxID=3402493 RepID=A0A9P0CGG8_9CUCU|nr:unnamed protein product [Psylliodes chrysocephala]